MNKPFITLGVIILLIVIAAGAVYTRRLPQSQNEKMPSKVEQKTPEKGSTMTSLKELLTMGKSQECTFSYNDPSLGSSEGKAYISGDKAAVTFNTTVENNKIKGNMINDGKYIYTWTDESNVGFKMEITESMEKMIDKAEKEEKQTQYIDQNAKAKYTCNVWIVDTNKFTPPKNINFTDFSDQQN